MTRQGFNGPIKLTVANPPPGLTIRPGLVNAGQTVGALTITASPDASFEVANLKLIGEGQGGPAPVVVEASKTIVFAEQGTLTTNGMVQEGLPAAISLPTAITLEAPRRRSRSSTATAETSPSRRSVRPATRTSS